MGSRYKVVDLEEKEKNIYILQGQHICVLTCYA